MKIKTNPVIGDIVKALSLEFQSMFRAKILNIENNGSCLVCYIDYGNTEVVQSSDIYELSEELLYEEVYLFVKCLLIKLN